MSKIIIVLFTFFLLTALTISSDSTKTTVDKQALCTSNNFLHLLNYPIEQHKDYSSKVIPYFKTNRGLSDEGIIKAKVKTDLERLTNALKKLTDQQAQHTLQQQLGQGFYTALSNTKIPLTFDHIGIEIYGPVEFYLNILTSISADIGLTHAPLPPNSHTADGNLLFTSTQVAKIIQAYDPTLQTVTIGKIFWWINNKQVALEIFSAEQSVEFTDIRLDPVTTSAYFKPIDHVAFHVNKYKQLTTIQHLVKEGDFHQIQLYEPSLSYNPSDTSYNIKLIYFPASVNALVPISSLVTEFIYQGT
ncbi:MAG: hypothetical protein V3V61_06635 [Gammaproteobacteria bacterium]